MAALVRSYYELTGRQLIEQTDDLATMAKRVDEAPFFVASHGLETDPVLDYGNRCALELFAMNWEEFTQTPSRLTAEAPNRAERERLLTSVTEKGFIDDYSGVRITADGRRFRIHQATVWNVTDESGVKIGQAATFSEWDFDL
ncbi:MAG: MEKHLA domain-containing protein [Akkermansiaceae bacterium]